MKIRIGLILLLMVSVAMAGVSYWQEKATGIHVLSDDTDNNNLREKYVLNQNQIKVIEGRRTIWHSPREWQIKQVRLGDADNDGRKELLMVVWKKGSYGNCRPWWVNKKDDQQLTCHLFIYRMTAGRMKAVWCSSALEYPIKQASIADVNRDGLNELQVQEIPGYGTFNRIKALFGNYQSLRIWNGWGFEQVENIRIK